MTKDEFDEKLRKASHPVVVDFWANWCVACRGIEPVVDQLAEDYAGRVEVWKVDVDQAADLLSSLHLSSIPTLIAFQNGREIVRRTGTAPAPALARLFDSALMGRSLERREPAPVDRLLRLGAGLALLGLAVLGGMSGLAWLVAGMGALILFTAVYDRCPIWKALTAGFKKRLG
jgi:thioredoxin 1